MYRSALVCLFVVGTSEAGEPKVPPPAQSTSTPTAQIPAAPPYTDLFNGKDLTGWKPGLINNARWRVEDGMVVGSDGRGVLLSDRKYKNFHLRAEVLINQGGNSGIFYRARGQQLTDLVGYEAQINANQEPLKTGTITTRMARRHVTTPVLVKEAPFKPGEWFTLEITADGAEQTVKVNGQVTAQIQNDAHSEGTLGLQAIAGQATVVKFRKVQIRELP